MKNMVLPPEDTYDIKFWTNGTGANIVSGQPLVFAGGIAVALVDIAAAAQGTIKIGHCHEYTKVSAQAWTKGQPIFYDTTAKKYTTVALGNVHAGWAFVAAANPSALGQVILRKPDGLRVVGGQHTTVAAADTIVTGLATVLSVVASYETDPADANTFVSAQIGNQAGAPAAGSVIIKTWKSADGADVTPVAATAFAKLVNWIAFGY